MTTLPAVSADQHGSGVEAERVERYDTLGNPTWSKDERGFIAYRQYDSTTGALVRMIQDVDGAQLTLPDGWSTPTGGGLHLVTDYEFDDQGRTTQTLGPAHDVDGTTVRTASWTVYNDAEHETRTAQGYATGSAGSYVYTLVNPVSIVKQDEAGKTLEQIQAVRASTAGRLTAADTFAQSSYCRWTTTQYDAAGQQISTRVYHLIPASGEGVSANSPLPQAGEGQGVDC